MIQKGIKNCLEMPSMKLLVLRYIGRQGLGVWAHRNTGIQECKYASVEFRCAGMQMY